MSKDATPARDSTATLVAVESKDTPVQANGSAQGMGKGKGKARSEGEKDSKWSTEDTAKLLFIMLQQESPKLLARGWQDVFKKVHSVFGNKYTNAAVKKYWQRLRKSYLDQHPVSEGTEEDAEMDASSDKVGAAKGKVATKAGASKSHKRAAHADDGQGSGKGRTGTPAKKARTVKKRSTTGMAADHGIDDLKSESGSDTPPKTKAKSHTPAEPRAKTSKSTDQAAAFNET